MVPRALIPFVFAFSLLAGLLVIFNQPARGETVEPLTTTTICVNTLGGGCYTSIQAAINAASPGDIINVAPGNYYEHITFNKNVTVNGAGWPLTVINGNYTTSQATVYFPPGVSSSAVLSGVQVTGGGTGNPSTSTQPGGGIAIKSSSPVIRNTWVYSCTGYWGGGVSVEGGSPRFINVPVWSNRAYTVGGGYYFKGAAIHMESDSYGTNGTVWFNSASNGGGIYMEAITATVTGMRVYWNTASSDGGGLYLNTNSYPVELTANIFAGNTAPGSGGGIRVYDSSNFDIQNNLFYSNTAGSDSGGGAEFYQSGGLFKSNMLLDNTSSSFGGGVRVFGDSSALRILGNWFENNHATTGGGLSVWSAASMVDANVFVTNTASVWGGGIQIYQSTLVTITNNILARNNSPSGAGIAVLESPTHFINNSVANNAGDGILFDNSNGIVILNNIVASNSGDGIENYSGTTMTYTVDYNDIYANPLNGLSLNTHDLTSNPLFVASGATLLDYYHLQPTSPVSATGTLSGAPLRDIDHEPRNLPGRVSMGADEIKHELYLPVIFR